MDWRLLLSICLVVVQIHVAMAAFGIPDFLEMGGCAQVKTKRNFDPDRYAGIWFTVETVENEYEQCKACINTNYTWMGDHFALTAKGLDKTGKKIRKQSMMHANEEEPDDWAHMIVDAEGVPAAPYKVVATDYVTYSCVYSCMSFVGFRAEFFWFMSRTPSAEPGLSELCKNTLSANGVDTSKFEIIDQGKTCPYVSKLDSILSWNQKYMQSVDKSLNKEPEDAHSTKQETTTKEVTVDAKAVEDLTQMVKEEKEILTEMEEKIEEDVKELKELEKEIKDTERRHRHHERKEHHLEETENSAMAQSAATAPLLLVLFVSYLSHSLLS
ncbi:crustacyanin-A2 subunit-like [Oratosquilla oratoria]|uniref:crustacyanin-A2 subunit-like n=1 Tax=Oratosquilla oratoria TaxID=337810 RepID=UPI003F7678D2